MATKPFQKGIVIPVMMTSKILLVDDSPVIQMLCQRVLAEIGVEVLGVKHLEGARKVLKEDKFDLLIIDLELPDGDGLDFIKELRTSNNGYSDKSIMVLSGYPSNGEDLDSLGITDYLIKPFDYDNLVETVKDHLSL